MYFLQSIYQQENQKTSGILLKINTNKSIKMFAAKKELESNFNRHLSIGFPWQKDIFEQFALMFISNNFV